MVLPQGAKRLFIFAFYDTAGIVDDYILYMLAAMRPFCKKQIVVVNGVLNPAGAAALNEVCDKVLLRENKGFDITGYRHGLISEAENLAEYDEVIFYNQTIFGPVCPLNEMFDTMAKKDIDFWGLTRHKGAKSATWNTEDAFGAHLQSYFFAVRGPMLADGRFLEYWQNLPPIESYWDAVAKHEVLFTRHFENCGYKWASYVNTEGLDPYNDYPLMGMPVYVLQNLKCPFFKRKSFTMNPLEYSTVPQGAAAGALYSYIKTKTAYPIGLATRNILRTEALPTVLDALGMYCMLKENGDAAAVQNTALVLWFARPELAQTLCEAADDFEGVKVYAIFAAEELKKTFEAKLPKGATAFVNKQHGYKTVFGELWPEIAKSTYLCYLSNSAPDILFEFADATTLVNAKAVLATPGTVNLLAENEEIGIVFPLRPTHQENFLLGANWQKLVPLLQKRLQQAGIIVPLNEKGTGVALRGGMFCARTAAMAPLCRFIFDEQDFCGLYPAYEFLPPLAAQSEGLLAAYACNEETLFAQLAVQAATVKAAVQVFGTEKTSRIDLFLHRIKGIRDFYYERRYQMTLEQAFTKKLSFKEKLWISVNLWLGKETFEKLFKKAKAETPPEDED